MENQVGIIATGTEITNGKSLDTNSGWIADQLTQYGFKIQSIHAYPDDPVILKKGIQSLLEDNPVHWLIATGGLGPTEDDYTVDVVCDIFQLKTYIHEKALKKLEEIYLSRGKKYQEALPTASRQTRVPEGCIVLENEVGIAPGFILKYSSKLGHKVNLVCMPGVPQEMKQMFQTQLLPKLLQSTATIPTYRVERCIWHIGESVFQKEFIHGNPLIQSEVSWGVAAKRGYIKVYFLSKNENPLNELTQKLEEKYSDTISLDVFQEVPKLLKEQRKRVVVAESCTGGWLSKLFTDTPGSSAYFDAGLVTYSNASKENVLFVPHTILNQYGAVSEPTAKEMLFGLEKHFDVDYYISITGIAGPDGGSPNKPVGTVFIGIKKRNNKPKVFRYLFPGNRDMVRESTANTALFLLYRELIEK